MFGDLNAAPRFERAPFSVVMSVTPTYLFVTSLRVQELGHTLRVLSREACIGLLLFHTSCLSLPDTTKDTTVRAVAVATRF